MIETLTKDVEVGGIYLGKVNRLMNFGAFVEILPGKEGLCIFRNWRKEGSRK